jgi:hypothetical protein
MASNPAQTLAVAVVGDERGQPSPSCLLLVFPDLLHGKDEERALFLQVRRRGHEKKIDLQLLASTSSSSSC